VPPLAHQRSDGLDAAASRALAEALEAKIESGRCADIERQAEAPKETCSICHGKGVVWRTRRQPIVDFRPCFACDGHGFHRPSSTFSVENVRNFAAFLRCGGFEIW
jgi:hypothetical protein